MRLGKLLLQDVRQKAYDIELFSLLKQMKEKYKNFEDRPFSNDCNNSEFFELELKNILATLENEGVDINSICEDEFYIVPVRHKHYIQLLAWKLLIVEQYEIALTLEYMKAKYKKTYPKSAFHKLINIIIKEYVKCYCIPSEAIKLDKITDWVLREQTNSDPEPIIENWEDLNQLNSKVKENANAQSKEYKSIVRARAFCLGILEESGKECFYINGTLRKKHIINFVKSHWKGSGKTVYEEAITIISGQNKINQRAKDEFPLDYAYGQKLYNQLFSD